MRRILVVGATGRVGREVVSQLAPTGTQVRAFVRDPHTACLPSHVDVVRGDLTFPETLDGSLDGVDAVFLVWCAPPATVAPALERIVRRARQIVFLSSPYKTAHPFFQAGQPNPISTMHAEIERRIEGSGSEWTFLRPGMFSANARWWWAPQIRAGADVVRWHFADAPTAPIDERDIAAIAVRALCDERHAGAEYVLTGPDSLTQREQVSIIGDVIGHPLGIEEIRPEEARREIFVQGPAYVAEMLFASWAAAIGQPAFVTSAIAEITGAPPRTFRQWVAEHASEFGA